MREKLFVVSFFAKLMTAEALLLNYAKHTEAQQRTKENPDWQGQQASVG
jgi:hypothetical protein